MIENNYTKVPNLPSNQCFACGQKNPIGLQLVFYSNGEEVVAKKYISSEYAGWERLVHGGILSTIADETMAWTVIHLTKKYILTKGFSIEFLAPLFVGQEISCVGKILEWIHEKEVIVHVKIYSQKQELAVSAKGNVVLFSPESIRKRNLFDESYLEDFEKSVFQRN
jgi:acyl-coenzyme A thioesterase PaaI-like protein